MAMRLPRITLLPLFAFFIATLIWLLLVLTAPLMVPEGTLTDLSGRVGYVDNEDQFEDLGALPHAIYRIGDVECHQLANRSYFINGNQMPFCARDLGIFVGLAAGFGLVSFYPFRPNPFYLLLGLVPMGIDGGLQLVTEYESTNPLRLATGFIAGVAASLLLAVYIFVLADDLKKVRGTEEMKPE